MLDELYNISVQNTSLMAYKKNPDNGLSPIQRHAIT